VLDASNTKNKIIVANSEVCNGSTVQEVSHTRNTDPEDAVVMTLHLPTCKGLQRLVTQQRSRLWKHFQDKNKSILVK